MKKPENKTELLIQMSQLLSTMQGSKMTLNGAKNQVILDGDRIEEILCNWIEFLTPTHQGNDGETL